MHIRYTALFVDDTAELTTKFQPKHARVFAHHSTIAFQPDSLAGVRIGDKTSLRVIGRVSDGKGDALLVENPRSTNKHPHITLSCAEGVSSSYSNELIERAVANGTVEYFDAPVGIAVTEGYSDGNKDVLEQE